MADVRTCDVGDTISPSTSSLGPAMTHGTIVLKKYGTFDKALFRRM